MNPDDNALPLDDVFDSDFIEDIKVFTGEWISYFFSVRFSKKIDVLTPIKYNNDRTYPKFE